MQAEEPLLEQLLVAQHRGIEGDAHGFGVAGLAVVRVVVRRVLEPAAGVADIRIENAVHVAQDVLDSPEAAAGQHGDLGLLRAGDRRAARAPLLAHVRPSITWSIRKIASARAHVNQASCRSSRSSASGPDGLTLGCVGVGQRERESRARARRARHGERAAHRRRELARDGEPEAGATHASGQRRVHLHERLEDGLELRGRRCRRPVSRTAMRTSPAPVVVSMAISPPASVNFVALESRLSSTCCARSRSARTMASAGTGPTTKRTPFACICAPTRSVRSARSVRDGHRLRFHGQSARVGARELEDVGDDRQQQILVPADAAEVLDLLGGDGAAQAELEQLGEPSDRVEGGAQLVTHHREELGLRRVRGEQRLVAVGERRRGRRRSRRPWR